MAGLSTDFNLDTVDPGYITAILAGEERSLTGPHLRESQNKMAHVIINRMHADKVVGGARGTAPPVAPTSLTKADEPWLASAYEATLDAIEQQRRGIDPTEGALEFGHRPAPPELSPGMARDWVMREPRNGIRAFDAVDPLKNSAPSPILPPGFPVYLVIFNNKAPVADSLDQDDE